MGEVFACEICGDVFDTKRGKSIHKSTAHSKPWHDEETLRLLYIEYQVSSEKMARYWGCDPKTVRNNLERYGVERRSPGHYQKKTHATYKPGETGYCYWRDYSAENTTPVLVHRLLAVAEYGFEKVMGKHVHHKDGVKWNNQHKNIELKTPQEHAKSHLSDFDRHPEEGHYVHNQEMVGSLE